MTGSLPLKTASKLANQKSARQTFDDAADQKELRRIQKERKKKTAHNNEVDGEKAGSVRRAAGRRQPKSWGSKERTK